MPWSSPTIIQCRAEADDFVRYANALRMQRDIRGSMIRMDIERRARVSFVVRCREKCRERSKVGKVVEMAGKGRGWVKGE
jgi:hypothetical protein